MRDSIRIRASAVGLAAAISLAAFGPAAAPAGATRIVKVPSRLTISAYAYFGKVKSRNRGCLSSRRVVLKQKGHGVLGRTTSGDKGSWRFDPSTLHYKGRLPFRIFAVLKPKSDGTAGTIYKCSGATSKTIVIRGG
jgi:hypothetical protein